MAVAVLVPPLPSCQQLGSDDSRPERITPDAWNQGVCGDLKSGADPLDQWWTRYRDPALVRLIQAAHDNKLTLQTAAERVTQARALRRQSLLPLLPGVNGNGGLTRSRSAENGGLPEGVGGQNLEVWSSGFDASWEVDFSGSLRRGLEAARANEAARVEHDRNERDRLSALDEAVSAARKTVELVQTNYMDGLVNFQNVVDAQRVLLQAEDNRAASRGQIAAGYARLFKSLGGGVVPPPAESPARNRR